MKSIWKTDIKDKIEFSFEGDVLRRVDYCSETGLYLYGRYDKVDGHLRGWELVKGVRKKQPDGTEVLVYPSTEQFGLYGWSYPSRTKESSLREALKIADKVKREEKISREIPAPKYLKDGRINPKWKMENSKH